MFNGRDASITIDKGCREGSVANILCRGGNFDHGIQVGTTEYYASIRLGGMQSQVDFFTGV
jgi:hypothetical protein